jgi:hypothetical protein
MTCEERLVRTAGTRGESGGDLFRFAMLAAAILAAAGLTAACARPQRVQAPSSTAGNQDRSVLQPAASEWLTLLTSWLEAIDEHKPHKFDMPARLVGLWSEADLRSVRTDYLTLVAMCARGRARNDRLDRPIAYKDATFTLPELQQLLRLTDAEAARGDANRILIRAAVFHADVAIDVVPATPGRIGCAAQPSVLVKDGNRAGSGCIGIHWAQGRLLLDEVRPDPGRDPAVRLWYQATTAYMLETGDYADAQVQLNHSAPLFPAEPGILFEHGLFFEGFASPVLQRAAYVPGTPVRSTASLLGSAEGMFRKAIEANGSFVEARVHHGFVLSALGRDDEAAEALRLAVTQAQGAQLRYYAELFLGRAEQSLGNRDAARDHYTRAAALYPAAQSPRLALSLLARQRGDRTEALEALRQLFAPPPRGSDPADPWWAYYQWQNENSDMLFRELDEQCRSGATR